MLSLEWEQGHCEAHTQASLIIYRSDAGFQSPLSWVPFNGCSGVIEFVRFHSSKKIELVRFTFPWGTTLGQSGVLSISMGLCLQSLPWGSRIS